MAKWIKKTTTKLIVGILCGVEGNQGVIPGNREVLSTKPVMQGEGQKRAYQRPLRIAERDQFSFVGIFYLPSTPYGWKVIDQMHTDEGGPREVKRCRRSNSNLIEGMTKIHLKKKKKGLKRSTKGSLVVKKHKDRDYSGEKVEE